MGRIGNYSYPKIKKVIQGVFQCALWAIWSWRNKVVNASVDSVAKEMEVDIFPLIQRVSKSWMSARCSTSSANWNVWIQRPFELFAHSS